MSDPTPDDAGAARAPVRRRSRRWIFWTVVGCLVGLILVGLLLPMRRCAREAARRSQCMLNLREIGMALREYVERHGHLPPAHTVDGDGRPLHSWRTLILPYLGERKLFESIDLTKPWDDPANARARARMPQVYRCPSSDAAPNVTAYVAVVSPEGCFRPDGSLPLAEIPAAAHDTLLVIEVAQSRAVPWMAPDDIDADEFLTMGADGSVTSHHGGGITPVVFADGACQPLFLSGTDGLSVERRRAMLTTAADSPPEDPRADP